MEENRGPKTALPLDFEYRPHLNPFISSLLTLISGVLIALAFEPFNLYPLAWIAFVPLLIAVKGRKDKAVFLLGCLAGLTFYLISLFWMRNIHWCVPFLLALLWSPLFGLWLWLTKKMWFYLSFPDVESTSSDARLRVFYPGWKKYLILIFASSCIWIFFEWLRFWLFSGFPWNILGVSQSHFTSIVPFVSLFGILGLSFILIFSNLSLSFLIESYLLTKKIVWQLAPLPLILLTLAIIPAKLPQDLRSFPIELKVLLVQGNFEAVRGRKPTQEEYLEQIQTYRNLSLKHAADKPDLIIWPETPVSSTYSEDPFYQKAVKDVARICRSKVLLGSTMKESFPEGSRKTNSALLVGVNGEILQSYDKIHLVPYGEYTPMKDILPESIWNWLNQTVDMGNLDPGTTHTVFKINDQFTAGVNICYEDVFPENSQQFIRNGANLLITLTNDSWYAKSAGGAQHTAHSIFRAAEMGLPMIRCGTTSESSIISSEGKILEMINGENESKFTKGTLLYNLKVHHSRTTTFYYRHPHLFIFLCSGIAILAILSTALHFLKRKSRLREIISGKN